MPSFETYIYVALIIFINIFTELNILDWKITFQITRHVLRFLNEKNFRIIL